jgi:hypothetical protein
MMPVTRRIAVSRRSSSRNGFRDGAVSPRRSCVSGQHPATRRKIVAAGEVICFPREKEGETIAFDDYRHVDVELVPFRSTIEDNLGTSTIVIDSVRFNVPLADSVFSPRR